MEKLDPQLDKASSIQKGIPSTKPLPKKDAEKLINPPFYYESFPKPLVEKMDYQLLPLDYAYKNISAEKGKEYFLHTDDIADFLRSNQLLNVWIGSYNKYSWVNEQTNISYEINPPIQMLFEIAEDANISIISISNDFNEYVDFSTNVSKSSTPKKAVIYKKDEKINLKQVNSDANSSNYLYYLVAKQAYIESCFPIF